MRLIRLLTASVGPFDTRARCQAAICADHREIVRPSWRTSGGHTRSWRSAPRRVDELGGEGGVVMLVDRADDLLGVPGRADLASRVAGVEQTEELGAATVVEAFVGLGEQPAAAVERVVLVAPVAQGLVLDPPATLVELRVRQLHQVERIRDLQRVSDGIAMSSGPAAGMY